MNIGALEKASGLKRSTIRVYERMGLLRPNEDVRRNGYRTYDQSHIDRLASIKLCQALGFTLGEVKALMAAWEGGSMSHADKIQALKVRLIDVREKREKLMFLEGWLNNIIAWVENGEIGLKPSL
ncbi:MAG: MerR family transcriptional regulator [Rhodocyclaceae bacterium]|nr:MerR family transcriptional regulator [Rhodocyclaceae bacterium]